jgi:hypothetical protein
MPYTDEELTTISRMDTAEQRSIVVSITKDIRKVFGLTPVLNGVKVSAKSRQEQDSVEVMFVANGESLTGGESMLLRGLLSVPRKTDILVMYLKDEVSVFAPRKEDIVDLVAVLDQVLVNLQYFIGSIIPSVVEEYTTPGLNSKWQDSLSAINDAAHMEEK